MPHLRDVTHTRLTDEKNSVIVCSLVMESESSLVRIRGFFTSSLASSDLRTLDCDTTFKPVAGEMQIFGGIQDRLGGGPASYSQAAQVQRTSQGGKIVGLNSNRKAAPLRKFADALAPTIDREDDVYAAVGTDSQAALGGIPELSHLCSADRNRLSNLKYAKTPEEVESFKARALTLVDPQGVLKCRIVLFCVIRGSVMVLGWWNYKLMHRWLLPGIIQCLSNIPVDMSSDWTITQSVSNSPEATVRQTLMKRSMSGTLRLADRWTLLSRSQARAEEIKVRMATMISRNSQSEVSQCCANRTAHQSRNSDKATVGRAADANVTALQKELSETKDELTAACSEAKAETSAEATGKVHEFEALTVDIESRLKLAKAEAKSSSSSRVRAKRGAAASSAQHVEEPAPSTTGPPSGLLTTTGPVAQGSLNVPAARRASARVRRSLWIRWPGHGWGMEDRIQNRAELEPASLSPARAPFMS
ncbi:hypothetical protein B0H16DRAFT_1449856 [Mycena metata]|uniref:Uncharacterized protein n=1 Tax=Mycena metata TaxID=1033252 RepID=A0AAD7K1K0_9AGAR|nr:hypothetical protein B0H16DRAFT_1449856 [Mycena metata]